MEESNYLKTNKESWNKRTDVHMESDFYDLPSFLKGNTSLNEIELNLLGDLKGKKILHLQCHFGQDTISLQRMGAQVTGVDLSDMAIKRAKELAVKTDADTSFICCDVYDLPNHLEETFDLVFTSYGTIGWLPDINKWASVVNHFLKPEGKFVFVEFHPLIWMYDDDLKEVKYNYFKEEPIVEEEKGTYANKDSEITIKSITWNHSLSEVFNGLKENGILVKDFKEYDYSPYNCFNNCMEVEKGKFRTERFGNKIPMVYSLVAEKK